MLYTMDELFEWVRSPQREKLTEVIACLTDCSTHQISDVLKSTPPVYYDDSVSEPENSEVKRFAKIWTSLATAHSVQSWQEAWERLATYQFIPNEWVDDPWRLSSIQDDHTSLLAKFELIVCLASDSKVILQVEELAYEGIKRFERWIKPSDRAIQLCWCLRDSGPSEDVERGDFYERDYFYRRMERYFDSYRKKWREYPSVWELQWVMEKFLFDRLIEAESRSSFGLLNCKDHVQLERAILDEWRKTRTISDPFRYDWLSSASLTMELCEYWQALADTEESLQDGTKTHRVLCPFDPLLEIWVAGYQYQIGSPFVLMTPSI